MFYYSIERNYPHYILYYDYSNSKSEVIQITKEEGKGLLSKNKPTFL
jgi:hypothetical protein